MKNWICNKKRHHPLGTCNGKCYKLVKIAVFLTKLRATGSFFAGMTAIGMFCIGKLMIGSLMAKHIQIDTLDINNLNIKKMNMDSK